MNREVKSILSRKYGLYVRSSSNESLARIKLEPLVTERIVQHSSLLLDSSVIDKAKKASKNKKDIVENKYEYLKILQEKLNVKAEKGGEIRVLDEEAIDWLTELRIAKESKHVYKGSSGSATYQMQCENLMNRNAKYDSVCASIKKQGTRKSMVELLDSKGIQEFLEIMSRLAEGDAAKKSEEFRLNRYYTTIGVWVKQFNANKARDILANLTEDNFEELLGIKGLNDLLEKSKEQLLYKEYIVGSLVDKFVSGMTPSECTQFFKELDSENSLFETFNFSSTAMKYLLRHQYRKSNGYKLEVLAVASKMSIKDARDEYERYVTPEFVSRYNSDIKVEEFLTISKSREMKNIVNYYELASSPRFLKFESDEVLTPRALIDKRAERVTTDSSLSSYIIWGPYWNDFVDRVDSENETVESFFNRVIKDEADEKSKVHRLTITQGDGMLLGGMTLYEVDNRYTLGVSIWFDVAMRHIKLAKEALWVLAKAIKEANLWYRELEFRVNNNNVYMVKLLNEIGANLVRKDTNNISVYRVNMDDICSKSIEKIRNISVEC